MGMRNIYSADKEWSPGVIIGIGIAACVIVVALVVLLLRAIAPEPTTPTLGLPASEVAGQPPQTITTNLQELPSFQGELDIPDGPTAPVHQGNAHGDTGFEDYDDKPIPPDQYNVIWPQDRSGLQPDEFTRARDAGAALVRAQITGAGREMFPGYFPSQTDPNLPYATNFNVQFATASAVPGHAELIRTVVLWQGVGAGNVPYRQVRIANYFTRQPDGTLVPVRNDFLPQDVKGQDGLLSGISILG